VERLGQNPDMVSSLAWGAEFFNRIARRPVRFRRRELA
jgi:hypothetical protein